MLHETKIFKVEKEHYEALDTKNKAEIEMQINSNL